MWAGYQQHPLCSLKTKQNKTFSPPPGFPISLNVPPFTQLLMLKTLQFSLIRFLVLFCFVCVCSCCTFSLSPNPVNSIFKIYLNPTTSHHLHHHLSLDFFYSFLVWIFIYILIPHMVPRVIFLNLDHFTPPITKPSRGPFLKSLPCSTWSGSWLYPWLQFLSTLLLTHSAPARLVFWLHSYLRAFALVLST